MGYVSKKIFKNKIVTNISMSIKFVCPNCKASKLIPKYKFDKMTNETFKDNKIFICDNCNIRMNPISVEVDY